MRTESLSQRVKNLGESAMRLRTLRDSLVQRTYQMEAQVATGHTSLLRTQKVTELFRSLVDVMVSQQVETIQKVVSDGLRTIFYDQNLELISEIGAKYNKVSIDFLFSQKDKGAVIQGKPLDAFGGGPTSVASLLLRVLTLLKLNRAPILLLDETLSTVSDAYIDLTGQFLQQLSKQVGVDILLITHKQAFLDHADTAYQASEATTEAGRHLVLKTLRT